MSLWTKVKFFLMRRTQKERAEWAYGLWLASPRTTNAVTFISNMTGIPREQVWGIIIGKKENNA